MIFFGHRHEIEGSLTPVIVDLAVNTRHFRSGLLPRHSTYQGIYKDYLYIDSTQFHWSKKFTGFFLCNWVYSFPDFRCWNWHQQTSLAMLWPQLQDRGRLVRTCRIEARHRLSRVAVEDGHKEATANIRRAGIRHSRILQGIREGSRHQIQITNEIWKAL